MSLKTRSRIVPDTRVRPLPVDRGDDAPDTVPMDHLPQPATGASVAVSPMPNPHGRIAVVGGGIAGTATALFLAGIGAEVVLFERRERPALDAPGMLLQPNGRAALDVIEAGFARRLGGVPVHRWYGEDSDGRVLLDVHYDDWRTGSHALGVHRGLLHAALWSLLEGSGARIVTGVAVSGIRCEDHGVDLSFDRADGRSRTETRAPARYDGIVLADGFGSALREQGGLVHRSRSSAWGQLWAIVPDHQRRFVGTYEQRAGDGGTNLGILPIGRPGGDAEVMLTWALRADRLDAWRTEGLEPWKARAKAFWPWAGPVIDAITDEAQVRFEPFGEVRMTQWHRDRVVVVGDAGHAAEPDLLQGANQALVDATTLAYAVGASYGRLPDAFARFSDVRRRNLQFHQAASRWFTSMTRRPSLGTRLMSWGLRLRAARGLAVQTIAGVRQGLFRPPIRLPGEVLTDDDLD